jgi:elongation factor P--beta-lysine ligase
MSDYNRTTRECSVSQLRPELFQAIRAYFQEHQLGELETETLSCIETISQKKRIRSAVCLAEG